MSMLTATMLYAGCYAVADDTGREVARIRLVGTRPHEADPERWEATYRPPGGAVGRPITKLFASRLEGVRAQVLAHHVLDSGSPEVAENLNTERLALRRRPSGWRDRKRRYGI